jgi:hypothetical protein
MKPLYYQREITLYAELDSGQRVAIERQINREIAIEIGLAAMREGRVAPVDLPGPRYGEYQQKVVIERTIYILTPEEYNAAIKEAEARGKWEGRIVWLGEHFSEATKQGYEEGKADGYNQGFAAGRDFVEGAMDEVSVEGSFGRLVEP